MDEENVKKVSSYLANTVLPKFVQDLCTLEVSPMDGQTLTEALHAHGINVRYMGKVSLYIYLMLSNICAKIVTNLSNNKFCSST